MQLTDFLQPPNAVIDLAAPSKERLFQTLSEMAARASGAAESDILTALTNREQLGSTGMGRGIAVPHATIAGLNRPFGLLARLGKPVDFDAIDEAPVDIVFLLLNPEGNSAAALKVLACMARTLRDEDTLKAIRSAQNAKQVYEAVLHDIGQP